MNPKIKEALEYIQSVAHTDQEELERQIIKSVPEEFVRFLDTYGRTVTATTPESAHGLMLLGYLVRVNEEKAGLNAFTHTQKRAQA